MQDRDWEKMQNEWIAALSNYNGLTKNVRKNIKPKRKIGKFDRIENIVKYLYSDTRPFDLHGKIQEYRNREKVSIN